MRIRKASSYILPSPTFVGTDGETPTNATGTPTCAVSREDGTALAAATVTQSDATDLGNYQAALTTTHTSQCDRLQITWTATVAAQTQVYTDVVEVVGAHYCTIPELRAMPSLDDTDKFPTALLRAMRDEFEDKVESICSTAFVPRYERDVRDGLNSRKLSLSRRNIRSVLSVKINGAVISETFDTRNRGEILRRGDVFPVPDSVNGYGNVSIAYEHGYSAPPPQLKRAALQTIRMDLLAQVAHGVPDNAISQVFDGTTIRYSTPDPMNGRPTGVLALDPILVDLEESGMGMY